MLCFEFEDGNNEQLLSHMETLHAFQKGWINLLPGIPDQEVPDQNFFSMLFGSQPAPTTMGTWLPSQSIGILHTTGKWAIKRLAGMDVVLPSSWRVKQDHTTRGLVITVPLEAPLPGVAAWMMQALDALSQITLTGTWQARVYED